MWIKLWLRCEPIKDAFSTRSIFRWNCADFIIYKQPLCLLWGSSRVRIDCVFCPKSWRRQWIWVEVPHKYQTGLTTHGTRIPKDVSGETDRVDYDHRKSLFEKLHFDMNHRVGRKVKGCAADKWMGDSRNSGVVWAWFVPIQNWHLTLVFVDVERAANTVKCCDVQNTLWGGRVGWPFLPWTVRDPGMPLMLLSLIAFNCSKMHRVLSWWSLKRTYLLSRKRDDDSHMQHVISTRFLSPSIELRLIFLSVTFCAVKVADKFTWKTIAHRVRENIIPDQCMAFDGRTQANGSLHINNLIWMGFLGLESSLCVWTDAADMQLSWTKF